METTALKSCLVLDPNKDLGARLRSERKRRGLNVDQACSMIGVSSATLKRWESGTGVPGRNALHSVLRAWGCEDSLKIVEGEPHRRSRSWSIETLEERPLLRLLRLKRRRNGLSLEDVARDTGLSCAAIHRFETGVRVPEIDVLAEIAASVGCAPDEMELLKTGLGTPEKISPLPIFVTFNTVGACPHFHIYHRLDRICSLEAEAAEPVVQSLREIIYGLAISGDYSALIEAWNTIRSKRGDHIEQRKEIDVVGSFVGLAKMNVARRPREAMSEYKRLRRVVPTRIRSLGEVEHTLAIIRMALLIGEREDADDLLNRIEESTSQFLDIEESLYLYRILVNDALRVETRSVEKLFAFQESTTLPVAQYTRLVAACDSIAKRGSSSEAKWLLLQCRNLGNAYGFGSPMLCRANARVQSRLIA